MSEVQTETNAPSYISRVIGHEAVRKGVAGALAGVVIAALIEAVWPSNS